MKTSISELQLMTETEKLYRINERLEEFHASNYDWKAVLMDKWSLAAWGQKGVTNMGMKWLLVLAAISSLCACAQKDENGNPTASSFSSTGMFNRTGGDVVIGGH